MGLLVVPGTPSAHPLGNFTVNRYCRLEASPDALTLVYILDLAEIPTFRELQLIDRNRNNDISERERRRYLRSKREAVVEKLHLTLDGRDAELKLVDTRAELRPGQGGLRTLRLTWQFAVPLPWRTDSLHVALRDDNLADRPGWKEMIALSSEGVILLRPTVPSLDLTDELRLYPPDMLSSPVDVRDASFIAVLSDTARSAMVARTQLGSSFVASKNDPFTALIAGEELTPSFMFFALLAALFWGAAHALSPGHGKTVVAAYLVGSRGTAGHALFLGTTVTITHTLGVFTLGLVTLFASEYILPEDLYPWISLTSGVIVIAMGLYLFVRRVRPALSDHEHAGHTHDNHHSHHRHGHEGAITHSHGGHTHQPPGSKGAPVTWRSLLALGVSGGMLPCPSALVVLLSAIALHRIGFGLLLIVAFSLGLAAVLTGIGLLMVYARRHFDRFRPEGVLARVVPAFSALVIMVMGVLITTPAFAQLGFVLPSLDDAVEKLAGAKTLSILGLGFVLGLKHALDADHLVAITAIVTEKRKLWSSSITGAIWGLGHTASLLVVGGFVIVLQRQIPPRMALMLEFAVGVMLVALGLSVLRKVLRQGGLHSHAHAHGEHMHSHPHFHDHSEVQHSHHGFRIEGRRPFLIGLVHGLAGSAAVMLLVLATIPSPMVGVLYIALFGVGSVGGMLVMSTAISIPFALTADRFHRFNRVFAIVAGVLSIGFGLLLMYEIGFVEGLFL